MPAMDALLQAQLDQRREQNLYRTRLNVASGCAATLQLGGRPLLNFCSNDYLGLASHP
ncbi:MAG TPA: 8-amino-7-oxononanoate synthase, partial [Porticoccaceae bacterium]|nr:8-amino-7-oxononanoate synthase [Porticoccaceae bacterium]